MSKPFFSVIIPALNEEKYLPNLLADLSLQTYQNFEVIVVDGKSDDQTVLKAKSYSASLPSLSIITSPKRHVCTQRNLGTVNALADWLIFMDADNRLPSYFLQGLKYRLESDPCDLASTWVLNELPNNLEKTISLAMNQVLELTKNSDYVLYPESMTIIKKSIFLSVGGFDENIHYAEGQSLTKKVIESGHIYRLYKDPTYSFSLRRLRKFGLLGLAGRMVRAQLATYSGANLGSEKIKKLYPMKGGQFFDKPARKKKSFVKNVSILFNSLNSPEKLKQTLTKLLED